MSHSKQVVKLKWRCGSLCKSWYGDELITAKVIMANKNESILVKNTDNEGASYLTEAQFIYPLHHFHNTDFGLSNRDIRWQIGDPCYAFNRFRGVIEKGWIQEVHEKCAKVAFDRHDVMIPMQQLFQPHLYDVRWQNFRTSLIVTSNDEHGANTNWSEVPVDNDVVSVTLMTSWVTCSAAVFKYLLEYFGPTFRQVVDLLVFRERKLDTQHDWKKLLPCSGEEKRNLTEVLSKMQFRPDFNLLHSTDIDEYKQTKLIAFLIAALVKQVDGKEDEARHYLMKAQQYHNHLIKLYNQLPNDELDGEVLPMEISAECVALENLQHNNRSLHVKSVYELVGDQGERYFSTIPSKTNHRFIGYMVLPKHLKLEQTRRRQLTVSEFKLYESLLLEKWMA